MTRTRTRTADLDAERRKRELGREYQAHGAARELWHCRDPEVLIEGPAGTGKSRAVCEKVVACLCRWPGSRALLVRKTKESMAESVLVTLEEKVLPPLSPMLGGPNRHNRQFYPFPNGSVLVVGGMDKPSKIMSTEYDMIAVFEATEISLEAWESLLTRMRNGKMPFQQAIADCNPDQPFHWLNKRPEEVDEGRIALGLRPPGSLKMTRLLSRHEDNPYLYDAAAGTWTDLGRRYIANLDALSGARLQRLRFGRWVAAEGAVYEDEWDPRTHVVRWHTQQPHQWQAENPHYRPFDPYRVRRWFASCDWGFRNAGVLGIWAIDHDDCLYLVRQVYRSGRTHGWWLSEYQRWAGWVPTLTPKAGGSPKIETLVPDPSDPEAIKVFRQAGVHVTEANNDLRGGIDRVRARLRPPPQGDVLRPPPALHILEDALAERDQELVKANLPACVEEEFGMYLYPKGLDGRPIKEDPIKMHDHGMDMMRYGVMYADGMSRRQGGVVVQATGISAAARRQRRRQRKPWQR